jgi:hypothetical protein
LIREPGARLFRGIFLTAFATLVYEVALIRVLSFTIWYHFAYVVISTALLGYGASGSLLAWRPELGAVAPTRTLARACLAAAVSGAGLLAVISAFPFDPMKILSERRDLGLMLLYEVGAVVPFFFSGIAVSLALREQSARVDRLYFWDLVGAGLGCLAAIWLMNTLTPPGAVLFACGTFALAAAAFQGGGLGTLALAATLLATSPLAIHIPFTPAESKHLSVHMHLEKMVPVFSRWTALFRTDVVEKRAEGPPITNIHEWGLSATVPYQAQRMKRFLTHDGSAGAPIYDMRQGNLDFLDDHVLKLPYMVARPGPKVLVIGVGGGRDVLTALKFGATTVTGIELDPVTVDLIQRGYADLANGWFSRPGVTLVAGEGRHFIERSREQYDVIQMTGVDTLAAQGSGAYVLAENYLYTVEAFSTYLSHLTPSGVLSVMTGDWNLEEPQAVGKMLLVARRALVERGVEDPDRHLVAVASGHLLTGILVRRSPFTDDQVRAIAEESSRLSFVPLVLAGRPAHPLYAMLLDSVGAEREALLARLPYVLDPVTDDSPFFFRFFRWSQLLSRELGPVHTTALGQLVLLVLCVSLFFLGAVLVLLPLGRLRVASGSPRAITGVLAYFLALGAGFMLLEISLMQRFVLYLGYPTYALSVVLFSLLVSLGVGSYLSRSLVGRESWALPTALVVVVVLVAAYRTGLPALERATLGFSFPARAALTVALLAPLGTTLGVFFPIGIRRAAAIDPNLVPWAWGVNGCASVAASVGAVLFAMSFGFAAVWVGAVCVYVVGVAILLLTTSPTAA